jgi:hypothetical protein
MRATRSVPGSGEVWARYLRHLVRQSLVLIGRWSLTFVMKERVADQEKENVTETETVASKPLSLFLST